MNQVCCQRFGWDLSTSVISVFVIGGVGSAAPLKKRGADRRMRGAWRRFWLCNLPTLLVLHQPNPADISA